MKILNNPFEEIDFRSGLVTHIENDLSRENLREDLLQVVFPENYLLDVGWYGSVNGFIVQIIRDGDWGNPVAKTQQDVLNLQEAVMSAVERIEGLINESI